MNEKSVYELFLIACNAYKAWWDCGRDFKDHADKFDVWEKAIEDYFKAAQVRRQFAIDQVRESLGMSRAR